MASLKSMGFGKTMEKKLCSVGIDSAEKLKKTGSKEAFSLLRTQYPNSCVVILYYLEAAIRGVDMKSLDASAKSELKEFFKHLY